MATGDTLRRLLAAYAAADEGAFRSAAFRLIGEERQRNHRLLADDLERIVLSKPTVGARSNRGSQLGGPLPTIPRDRDRGLELIRVENPEVPWHRLILADRELRRLKRLVDEQRGEHLLAAAGMRPTRTVLFVGPPGTGKTLAARVLASDMGYPLYVVRFDAIVSSLLGETAANLARVFDFLESARGVVLFDEFDAVAKERADESEHGELKRVVNALLQLMDAYAGSSLLVAATNHEGLLDSAIWRRFETVIRFRLPSRQDRVLMLRRFLNGIEYEMPALESVATKTEGASGSDLERIATYAARTSALQSSRRVEAREFSAALDEYVRRGEDDGLRD
jgi:SpoVK/Ycf46/Vps4 family AAA+-type ATPase